MDNDIAKDSNMEATVIARTLDLVDAKLKAKGCEMPRSICVNPDNTAREAKNQHFLKFLAFLHATGVVDEDSFESLRSGHSHAEIDQRFSVAGTKLAMASCLEDPLEFAELMKQEMTPVKNREIHIEKLTGTWDFKEWFAPVSCEVSGLTATATHKDKHTNHVWVFTNKNTVVDTLGFTEESIDVDHVQAARDDRVVIKESDPIMLVKQFMHSQSFTQTPQLLIPSEEFQKLDPSMLKPAQRNSLGDTVLKEFRKTALNVGAPPWNLVKAENYLNCLCDNNEAMTVPTPPKLEFIFKSRPRPSLHAPLAHCNAVLDYDTDIRGVVVKIKKQTIAKAKGSAKKPATKAAAPKAKGALMKKPAAAAAAPGAVAIPGLEELVRDDAPSPGDVVEEAASPVPVGAASPGLVEDGAVGRVAGDGAAGGGEDGPPRPGLGGGGRVPPAGGGPPGKKPRRLAPPPGSAKSQFRFISFEAFLILHTFNVCFTCVNIALLIFFNP